MKKLAIIGAGHLGQLIAHHTSQLRDHTLVGFFDDTRQPGNAVAGKPVLGRVDDVQSFYDKKIFDCVVIGIGYKHFNFRKELFVRLSQNIPFTNIIHPSAYVDPSCKLGSGIFILPGCTLDHNVTIHDNVLINTGSVIAHDSTVHAHSFLSPAVTVAGFVSVGECCNIGINTTIIDNILIAANTQTGGGTVVIKNLEIPGLYVGNPARLIRKHEK